MNETLTHALTVHQPYSWALAAGHKPVENRTWRPPLAMVGKLIGIHAGLGTPASWAFPPDVHIPDARHLTYGALIGVARLVGVVRRIPWRDPRAPLSDPPQPDHHYVTMRGRAIGDALPRETTARIDPWWRGPCGWLMEDAVLLPEPIPMRGQQGLWRIPSSFAASTWMALEQWRKARETR